MQVFIHMHTCTHAQVDGDETGEFVLTHTCGGQTVKLKADTHTHTHNLACMHTPASIHTHAHMHRSMVTRRASLCSHI